ncbi:MAG: phosphatidylglycerophosphatase A [Deferribacteres bacterium]|nr:phosphatidylglycerophosphatase A [candidate division KSB1 bacterium]MCB9502956.1 phosphatidylglycerophosphatase A [Deferribacteres bacterium]
MNSLFRFIATGAWSGYFPIAPGTAGSALAILCLVPVSDFSSVTFVLVTLLISWIGIMSAAFMENSLGIEDPSIVVIDEIAGILFSVAFLPANWLTLMLAFFLFRLFDIIKPWPCRQAEKSGEWLTQHYPENGWLAKNKGGIGIMLDDILAGIYTNMVIVILTYYIFN